MASWTSTITAARAQGNAACTLSTSAPDVATTALPLRECSPVPVPCRCDALAPRKSRENADEFRAWLPVRRPRLGRGAADETVEEVCRGVRTPDQLAGLPVAGDRERLAPAQQRST
jgi:hypothetical protein